MTIQIREGEPVQWDEVVRQADPPEVPAVQQAEAFTVHTAWGEVLTGRPGDWLLGAGDDRWPVGAAEFAATYTEVGPDRYVKTGWARVKRMGQPFVVHSREGAVEGAAGDYLLEGPLGDRWRIAAEKYPTKGYVPVSQLPDGLPPPPVPYPTTEEPS